MSKYRPVENAGKLLNLRTPKETKPLESTKSFHLWLTPGVHGICSIPALVFHDGRYAEHRNPLCNQLIQW